MFGNMTVTYANPDVKFGDPCAKYIEPVKFPMESRNSGKGRVAVRRTVSCSEGIQLGNPEFERRRASALVDELLVEIYNSMHNGTTDYYSTSGKSQKSVWMEVVDLHEKGMMELYTIIQCLRGHIARTGSALVRQLKRRDALRRQQQAHCDVITKALMQRVPESTDMRFTIQPTPGESGFSQWVVAMKMVAQLPGGIPPEFRRRLWLTMAEKHLISRGVDWTQVEKSCFSEWSHPSDAELGIQIVKDLHRTGCSLFCGENGQENQALLKKVLLAYARWNKAVGYCQGFNMLAALILQVTDKCESDALKLMIYLIEGVLPDSYFADSLRGLSVDMAVFRELLRSKLPRLSKHLDLLQNAAKDGSRSYEPPLTNVFTMQWFLTLFCNCLPQPTVLRVWDLIFLEGNEILLRTALAIWQVLAQRILVVRTADEFYCIMGVLTRELLEFNLIDANSLIKAIVSIGPLTELKSLRDHYLYNITPWGTAVSHSEDKPINLHPKHSIPLDISALKKQYVKLKQRQRQAHIIFSAAISKQPPQATPIAMNHLLLGKRALVPSKRLGPPKGSIPPARQVLPSTLQWKDTQKPSSSSSSSDTELCDDDVHSSSEDEIDISKSQFKDNLDLSDTNLIKSDNTVENPSKSSASTETAMSENATSLHLSTDNQTTSSLSVSPVNLKFTSDSEDESSEFEIFLADRVKSFKESNPADQSIDDGDDDDKYIRRNSERALQIIQENSLILHRIMQCQSRLSPSPPLLLSNTSITMDSQSGIKNSSFCPRSYVLNENLESADTSLEIKILRNEHVQEISRLNDNRTQIENDVMTDKPSPEYGSRYHSILEKSKSLDERYNSLILNSYKDAKLILMGGLHESKSETPVGSKADNTSNSTSYCSNIFVSKTDCQKKTALFPISDDTAKDTESDRLIQENLDLLKTFSLSKIKENTEVPEGRSNLSEKLIQENVNLLELISNEKKVPGNLLHKETSKSLKTDDELMLNIDILNQGIAKNSPECFDDSKTSVTVDHNREHQDYKDLFLALGISDSFSSTDINNMGTYLIQDNTYHHIRDSSENENCSSENSIRLLPSDSAISMNFESGTENLSRNGLECDLKLESKELTLDLIKYNVKRSHSLSPVDFKSKTDDDYSCDKKTRISEDKTSPILNLKTHRPGSPFRDDLSISASSPIPSKCISPTKASDCDDVLNLSRSQNHIYSPFPVTLSSRQSKEVPLKLGIYKK